MLQSYLRLKYLNWFGSMASIDLDENSDVSPQSNELQDSLPSTSTESQKNLFANFRLKSASDGKTTSVVWNYLKKLYVLDKNGKLELERKAKDRVVCAICFKENRIER